MLNENAVLLPDMIEPVDVPYVQPAGTYDLSREVTDIDGAKSIIKNERGVVLEGLDCLLDFCIYGLMGMEARELPQMITQSVVMDRLKSYKSTPKIKEVPLSADNITLLKEAFRQSWNKWILFRLMQVIDPSGLKE